MGKNNITDTYIPPKEVADDYFKLPIFKLNKPVPIRNSPSGSMSWSNSIGKLFEVNYTININFLYVDNCYIRLQYVDYDINNQVVSLDYRVYLTTTPCNYGGERYWFKCPVVRSDIPCEKRVGVLYKPSAGCTYFACRHCYNLTYESSKVSGSMKQYGVPASIPELENMRKQIKKKFHKGEFTKRFRKYLIKLDQFEAYHNAWMENFYSKYLNK